MQQNDGLTSEFYEAFWFELKTPLLLSYKKSFLSGELSISQKQAFINFIEKEKEITLFKNWRPISLLNIDAKLFSKVLAKRIEKTFTIFNTLKSNCLEDKIFIREVN